MGKPPIEIMLDTIEWKPIVYDEGHIHGDLPHATHTGILKIGEAELECVVLNTGQRLFTAESLEKFFREG